MKTYFIILGNGFTIDLLKTIANSEIDVVNLFSQGDLVPWPADDSLGFLSYRNCPALWQLGIRPGMPQKDGLDIMEDILTCANTIVPIAQNETLGIYPRAYRELTAYLRSLFIHYNSKVVIEKPKIQEWSWMKFFFQKYNETDSKIIVVSFNYDIFLERCLESMEIDYAIGGFDDTKDKRIVIYKPHGSISFVQKDISDKSAYQIDYSGDNTNVDLNSFDLSASNILTHARLNAIVPPAGDSKRLNFKWASQIREEISQKSNDLTNDDELIICGISYWHVDRQEVDQILLGIPSKINTAKVINPSLNRSFSAILMTLFPNFINFTSSKHIA